MKKPFDVEAHLAETAAAVDRTLDRLLPGVDVRPSIIHEAMRYSAIGAGKRLRACLALESAVAAGGDRDAALPLAAAIEMIHAYSLVHDDLPCMDDDDMRRGKPSNHKVFGEGIAVLTGDALLTHAFDVLANLPSLANTSAEVALRIVAEISRACGTGGLIGGQVVDLEAAGKPADAETLDFIHRNKTGALFKASIRTGAMLGGASDQILKHLTEYARHFGLAFQIVDDLLDVTGSPEKLGKATGRDAKLEKLTYPRLHGVEQSRMKARYHIEQALHSLEPLGEEKTFVLRALADFVLHRDK